MAETIKKTVSKTSKSSTQDLKLDDKIAKKSANKSNTEKKQKTIATTEPVLEIKTEQVDSEKDDTNVRKAGKRSEKGIKEALNKQEKLERQANTLSENDTEHKKSTTKHVQKTRSKLERSSKNYRRVSEILDSNKSYGIKDALDLAVKTNPVKFDATVELHVRLGLDPKQADQNLRDTITLPSGTGKAVRVAVFAEEEQISNAKLAGADIAASDEFLQQLDKGIINFDILIVSPQQMSKLGKYARLLGPKGLMPNPKSGTVTTDIAKAVTEAKAGRLEYRVDSTGIIHAGIGKVSFGSEKLLVNAQALFASIKNNKPTSLKGVYVKSVFVTTSMGPSIPIETSVI